MKLSSFGLNEYLAGPSVGQYEMPTPDTVQETFKWNAENRILYRTTDRTDRHTGTDVTCHGAFCDAL
jgi:hypothetical protein